MPFEIVVVDDSNFMRKALSKLIGSEPGFEVVATYSNGEDAAREVPKVKPSAVILDVEMGGMDGLATLQRIMATCPTPVIMFSAHTKNGAEVTLKALQAGAVDFMEKPSGSISMDLTVVRDELIKKIRVAMRGRSLMKPLRPLTPNAKLSELRVSYPRKSILAIGSSTGGVQALHEVIPKLPAHFPMPVVIVQHMPPLFTKSLADSMNSESALKVKEGEEGDILLPGNVYIAPGGFHMTLRTAMNDVVIHLDTEPSNEPLRPSVDVLFNSVANVYAKNALGVILTGMGSDGAKGLKNMKSKGALGISQDEASCVVYGMPRFAAESADVILPINQIASQIEKMVL